MIDIWHTPPQTPDVFKSHPIIVIYEAGDEIEQMDSTEYSDLVGERYVNRWCYVDDLLALEAEMERTREALVKGMEHITGLNNMIESWYKLINSDLGQETKLHILKSAISAYVENKGGDK